jgi:aldehyde:ferredoxin oxidoreductase
MNASGACMMGWAFGQAPRGMVSYAEYLTAVTGLNFTAEELNRTAERIANIRHAFNLREGIIELNWTVHPRIIGNPPLKEGPLAGVTADIVTQDAWNLGALDWDMISTKPSVNKLKQLGLEDLIPDIYPPKK